MSRHVPEPGDRLLVAKGVVTHCGTYMGNGIVAHNSPASGPAMVPISTFSGGKAVGVVASHRKSDGLQLVRFERFSRAHPRYGLLSSNCEHLCSFLETGARRSPQVTGAVLGATLGYTACKALDVQNPSVTVLVTVMGGLLGARAAAPGPGHVHAAV